MNAPPDRRAANHRAAISAHCRSDEAARVAALAAELAAPPSTGPPSPSTPGRWWWRCASSAKGPAGWTT